ncbi:MAG: PAS domain-containing protein [Candidatus Hydrogenedentes bacterium]|nr:PAS domain-containing protein [Candidatus Hydrogenedentota bacterium]
MNISTTDSFFSESHLAILTSVFDQFPEDFLFTDSSGKVLYANSSFELSTGYQSDQLLGNGIAKLVKNPDDEMRYAEVLSVTGEGKT